jgi:hypothetical protein
MNGPGWDKRATTQEMIHKFRSKFEDKEMRELLDELQGRFVKEKRTEYIVVNGRSVRVGSPRKAMRRLRSTQFALWVVVVILCVFSIFIIN